MTVGLASSDGVPAPFVRSATPRGADRPVPDGWVVEAAGVWRRGEVEVVYDPRRHDVMVTDGLGDDGAEAALRADGWMRCTVEGRKSLWARDRVVAAQRALARSDLAAASAPPAHRAGMEHPTERPEPARGLGL